jgi:three-Cys-motif partner protein
MAEDFHNKPFDEGTITKLQIFELYAREWLPVFLAPARPIKREVHVFDFFSGPGTDARGEFGSPLRLLRELAAFQHFAGWTKVRVHAHFFDASSSKISQLRRNIDQSGLCPVSVSLDVQALEFHGALARHGATLASTQAAKLLFIDQCGVDQVTPEVFRRLVTSPTCDFLFFLSSSTLHRFRDHPAIKQKITRPDDYYQVHRAALEYYRGLLPDPAAFYLAPFSIKKGANIYGVIFGSAHPLGLDKFLQVAWKKDEINGEADFDIGRKNMRPGELLLPLDDFRPTKVKAFERDLEQQLRAGHLRDEADITRLCFDHGVKRQHAEPVLKKLKKEGVIALDFRVPQVDRLPPRRIRLLRRG